MLAISRYAGQGFYLDGEQKVFVRIVSVGLESGRVKIAIDAPDSVIVKREELADGWEDRSQNRGDE